jgi:hypothetical protein
MAFQSTSGPWTAPTRYRSVGDERHSAVGGALARYAPAGEHGLCRIAIKAQAKRCRFGRLQALGSDDEEQRRPRLSDPRNAEVRLLAGACRPTTPVALPVAEQSSRAGVVTGVAVIQQPALGESCGRIHARPVVAAADPLLSSDKERQGHGCFDPGKQNQRESFATQSILNPLSSRTTLPATRGGASTLED